LRTDDLSNADSRTPAADEPGSSSFQLLPPQPRDDEWMGLALDQARIARDLGEVPVGAIIVRDQVLISAGYNLTQTRQDPIGHAEMVAIRLAAERIGHWRLLDCTLFVTLEPCAMCAGAIVLARIPRLVFGAWDPKAGMCGSIGNLVQHPRLNHRVELTPEVRGDESAELLREFFRERRALGRKAPPPG
jgi:tRNA(adenine34) deaminase